jgi:pimeloyl-ACP methyl ester carboxylesterase
LEDHDGTVHIGGVDLGYEERGAGGLTVLLIHGTAARLWGSVADDLAASARTIDYDRRSFGVSAHSPVTDLTRHRDDAAALLDALGAGPAVLVGWSIGGVIALDLALTYPDRVRALVLIEPPLHAKRRPTLPMLRAIGAAQVLGGLGRPEAGARAFLGWALGRRDGGGDLDRVPPAWRTAMLANAAAIVAELRAGTGEHIRPARLGDLDLPVTVLAGSESDRVFGACARRLAAAVPDAELREVSGAGHVMQHDRPDAVVAAVRRVLAADAGAGGAARARAGQGASDA